LTQALAGLAQQGAGSERGNGAASTAQGAPKRPAEEEAADGAEEDGEDEGEEDEKEAFDAGVDSGSPEVHVRCVAEAAAPSIAPASRNGAKHMPAALAIQRSGGAGRPD
jgi:hypothetical protein